MTNPTADPFASLAIGLNEDRKAEAQATTKRRGTKKTETAADVAAKAKPAPEPEAATDPERPIAPEPEVEQNPEDATIAATDTTETPAAPGDEPDAVLERRIDRLQRIVEEAQFEAGTCLGDLRDGLLDMFKHNPKPWTAMTGEEKRRMERAATVLSQQLLQRVVLVIAEEDSRTLQATLSDNFGVKGEKVEGKIVLEHVNGDVLLALHGMAGKRVVIVDASDSRFSSVRRTTDHGNDEPDLPFESGSAPAAAPTPAAEPDLAGPEGDDDLNPGDDSGSAVDAAIDAWDEFEEDQSAAETVAGDLVGIVDTVSGEWLITEQGGDDGWTSDWIDAGQWSPSEADRILGVFEDANLEARAVPAAE